ncbi:MAG: hypothetical protein WC707_05205 [Candidatus Babeliaceae bacterium]|jgi:hypothetical protein
MFIIKTIYGDTSMTLDNPTYNKIKLIHELSCILWFIEKHALADAHNGGDKSSHEALAALQRDLSKHIEALQKSMCTITH